MTAREEAPVGPAEAVETPAWQQQDNGPAPTAAPPTEVLHLWNEVGKGIDKNQTGESRSVIFGTRIFGTEFYASSGIAEGTRLMFSVVWRGGALVLPWSFLILIYSQNFLFYLLLLSFCFFFP
jgi:hypothetical protein